MSTITTDLMETVDSLPIDMKLELVDKILDSLTPRQKDIDELWQIEAERRVEEVRSGKVKTIPGEQVFAEIRQRFGK
ncbi:MAG TPA: addiction module protein [Pyrinomonadaceae bacterium]|nr:addiction module protein [Pyrinomonadaceae bacterium]